jgi:hypothetical protein
MSENQAPALHIPVEHQSAPKEHWAGTQLFAVEKPAAISRRARRALLAAVIALVCAVAAHGIGKGEFDFNVDEAQHAVTGLFVADAMRDMPLRHPVEYAYRYYAQYPSIALVHWPPLFYVVEGLSFLALGSGVVAARITVLLFLALLLYQWFRLVEELQGPFTAVVATIMLATIPLMLLFEKTVMLEIPSLALAVAAIREWIRYLDDGRRATLIKWALWTSAALLCKQTSVYIFVFCLLSLASTRRWERIWTRKMWLAVAICGLLAGPFYMLMLLSHGASVAKDLGSHQMTGMQRLGYYWKSLPRTFSTPLLGLAVLGVAMARRWNRRGQTALMLCWIAAGYLTFTFFGQNEARFAIYWFPPLVYFAAGLLTEAFQTPWMRRSMRVAACALVALMTVHAWGFERPYISGYQAVAQRLVGNYGSGIVLFDGRVPGNFVFFMRSLDPRRQFLVLRKSLYVNDVRKNENSEELLHTREELLNLFHNDGIRFAVVSENSPLDFPSQMVLRQCLQSDQFQLLGRFSIGGNEPSWKGTNLLLYENKRWAPPVEKVLRIRMLTLTHDVEVPLDQFDFVRQQNAGPASDPAPAAGKQ